MERKSLIGIILAAILGIFGIGAGVRHCRKRKKARIDEAERDKRKQNRIIENVQRNQLEIERTQQETLKMLKKMQNEMGMDPNDISTEIDED